MGNMNISVDMGRVQSSVQAAIRPAVEESLKTVDVQKMIAAQLTAKRAKSERGYIMSHLYGQPSYDSLLEEFIDEGIREITEQYVKKHLMAQRQDIEAALHKMLEGSQSRLAKAFMKAVEDAFKSEWGFELDVKVSATTEDDDD